MDSDGGTAREKPSLLQHVSAWIKDNLPSRGNDGTLREAIEEVLEEHDKEAARLAPEEKIMLKNMLTFGELKVSDIMVPRTNIAAVENNVTLEQLKRHIVEQRHTRIPIYNGTADNVKGFVHVKDLVPMLGGEEPFDLQKILRQILYVPPSMRIVNLLLKMRLSGVHMAIVVDEYGVTDGLVTLEDLFEEIVGDIQDEHDEIEEHERLTMVSDRVIDADARITLDKLEEELGLRLVDEDEDVVYETLAGLISFFANRVPSTGDKIEHASGTVFEILEADARRIRRVRIHLPHSDSSVMAEGK